MGSENRQPARLDRVLTWSAAGAVFAIWTFANLVPRADAIYKRYNELFGEQLRTQRRKRIIPYIY